jgi:ribosomal protein S18 acetylase RimI-like enzyme
LKLDLVTLKYAQEVCDLINISYRGSDGWTKETHLIKGDRISLSDVKKLIQKDNNYLLAYFKDDKAIATISLEMIDSACYIGAFAVSPYWQNKNIGKEVLKLAQNYAIKKLHPKKFVMVVVSQREELIRYYERRGYKRLGKKELYPVDLNVGIPLLDNLQIEYLEKTI